MRAGSRAKDMMGTTRKKKGSRKKEATSVEKWAKRQDLN